MPNVFGRARSVLRTNGVVPTLVAAARTISGAPSRLFADNIARFAGKVGVEVGGPSAIFRKRALLPVYPIARRIDNASFSGTSRAATSERSFQPDAANELGQWLVADLTDLSGFDAGAYDFALASHALEHSANPLRALSEFHRLLRDGGALLLVLPDKRHTFDHRRAITSLAHLVDDRNANIGEDDLTHLADVLAHHDLARDPGAPQDAAAFRARCEANATNRCMHHHVFDLASMRAMIEHAGFTVRGAEARAPHHLIVLATKQPA